MLKYRKSREPLTAAFPSALPSLPYSVACRFPRCGPLQSNSSSHHHHQSSNTAIKGRENVETLQDDQNQEISDILSSTSNCPGFCQSNPISNFASCSVRKNNLARVEHFIQVVGSYEDKIISEESLIENFNQPYLDVMSQYDDGLDLSNYDFNQDGFGAEFDDVNKRKLAYMHRDIAHKYKKVIALLILPVAKDV
ncbi:hypothetical protein M9H77_32216 [Catharanthus roseus]|uniref:Uncharacterized protein n=1 Tax=Catharanthus roseus TaxID=4058 RepID=A0ACC0A2M1_CATRO|nr:hypothetical protein M9H77_32216 [Catharanthus roseus]